MGLRLWPPSRRTWKSHAIKLSKTGPVDRDSAAAGMRLDVTGSSRQARDGPDVHVWVTKSQEVALYHRRSKGERFYGSLAESTKSVGQQPLVASPLRRTRLSHPRSLVQFVLWEARPGRFPAPPNKKAAHRARLLVSWSAQVLNPASLRRQREIPGSPSADGFEPGAEVYGRLWLRSDARVRGSL